jgi:MFS family permease
VFSLAALLSYTDRQILGLLVDPIRADLHFTDTDISLLQGVAFALIYSVAGLPLGRLADVFLRRAVIIAGVLIWTAGTVACGLAHGFTGLFIARIVVGIGEAALAPAAMSMITDLFPAARRGTAIGVFLMGMLIGGGAALSIGGFLLQAAQSGLLLRIPWIGALAPWRSVLVLLGLPGIVLALLLLTISEPARRPDAALSPAARHGLAQAVAALLERRGLVLPLLGAMALMSVGDFSLLSWLPSVLMRNYHYSAGAVGGLLGGVAMSTGALGAVVSGMVSDARARRGGPPARILVAAVCATAAWPIAMMGFTSHGWMVLALFAWWNLFSTAAGTAGITALQEAVPGETRGLTVAMISFGNIMLGLGAGTMCTALITDRLFQDPQRVAASLSLVVGPAAFTGSLCFWSSLQFSKAFRLFSADKKTLPS